MHGVWDIILDEDFVHACTYGIVVKCIDGYERRLYPRVFTYSADYPEKFVQFLCANAMLTYKPPDQGFSCMHSRKWAVSMP